MRKHRVILACIAFSVASFSSGCRRTPELREAVVAEKAAARRRAEALLNGLDAKITDLRGRAESTAARGKAETGELLSALEEKKTAVQLKLDELKASSKEAAGDAAKGLNEAADDLERAYRSAADRFGK